MKYYKRLPLQRMSNCRDLGGYPSKFGSATNFGVFLRSEAPVNLDAYDIDFLKSYGVTKSLDFRGDADLSLFPSSLNTDGIEYIRLPMFGRADAMGFDDNADDPSVNFTGWGKSYIQWIECFKGWVRDVFKELASTEGICHFNCNAGKDRTGIVSAFVLALSGVEISDIAFDYCISRAMLKPRFAELSRQWGDYLKDDRGRLITTHPFLYTPRDAMYQLFKYINSRYINIEKYLYSCGVSEKEIYIIRSKMIGK
ncbi:MAG: tyrosine-protein phosphatase [Ruminococcus sp.]|nr:tyrosine-protein phosphatase [Ruminococcus sp.]